MTAQLRPALVLFAMLTRAHRARVSRARHGLAQVLFPAQANGSLIRDGDRVVGSALIGQPFADPRYFWSRPSATAPFAYNAAASSGSNQGPSNPALRDAVKSAHRSAARGRSRRTARRCPSTSSPRRAAASTRTSARPRRSIRCRASRARAVSRRPCCAALVEAHIEARTLGLLGEPRVNVLLLNLELERN